MIPKSPYEISGILTLLFLFCVHQLSYALQDIPHDMLKLGHSPVMRSHDSIRFCADDERLLYKQNELTFDRANRRDTTELFSVEGEHTGQGKTYQVGRVLFPDFTYGPLTLRVIEAGTIAEVIAPIDENPDLEMSHTRLIELRGRPFFFVIDRYAVYLVDLENEKISAKIEPGLGVEYGDDSISGTVSGFQFFDQDNYLLGIAVGYGLFCFNITDLDQPKELLRYSSLFYDRGQPYLFLEKNLDGSYRGIVSKSDTRKKARYISNFYTATEKATYLFKDAQIILPNEPYIDPVVDETPRPFLLFYEKTTNDKEAPLVIDLKKGKLLRGKALSCFSH